MARYFTRWRLFQRMEKEAAVEHRLLFSSFEKKVAPDPLIVEIVSYKSDNPWFRSEEFRKLLIDYRLTQYPMLLYEHRERKRIDAKHRNARKRNRKRRRDELKE